MDSKIERVIFKDKNQQNLRNYKNGVKGIETNEYELTVKRKISPSTEKRLEEKIGRGSKTRSRKRKRKGKK